MTAPTFNHFYRVTMSAACFVSLSQLLPSFAQGQTRAICGQQIQSNVQIPAADVPAHYASFVGVWVGGWNSTGRCTALIVSEVNKDGSAQATFIAGNQMTSVDPSNNGGGRRTTRAAIVNGVLSVPISVGNMKGAVEYTMSNSNSLAAYYNVPGYQSRATLTRR